MAAVLRVPERLRRTRRALLTRASRSAESALRRRELSPHYAEIADQRLRAELSQDDFVLAGPEA
ncbi:hypothetical protein [Kitasatospora sp. A2-31]|uniref:hypothetical protein n=1 Tax=Kitasatospora sp. A2-31 TaxID=2916414 RepID=UPI0035AC1B38